MTDKAITIWQDLGFRSTPYHTHPLKATDDGVLLHVARTQESAEFLTQIEHVGGGIVVISGDVGLGKTSFLNVQQRLLGTNQAGVALRLLINRDITGVTKDDTAETLARHLIFNLLSSIVKECDAKQKPVPKETEQLQRWMSHEPRRSHLGGSFQILSTGLSIERGESVTQVAEMRLENWKHILALLVAEVKERLQLHGIIIAVDNTENLPIEDLVKILMSYRDTLFAIDDIWWVIIGPKNLYSQIANRDPRVSQRMLGSGIELRPLNSGELHELVEKRIRNLRIDSSGKKRAAKSPLSPEIHKLLYAASCGQPRYMLKAADDLFRAVLVDVRMKLTKENEGLLGPGMLNKALRSELVDDQVPDELAERMLRTRAVDDLRSRGLSEVQVSALRAIGANEPKQAGARAKLRQGRGSRTSAETLALLEGADLIVKMEQLGGARYALKGDAWICNHYGDWGEFSAPVDVLA
jgi:hypothetical protein